MLLAMPHENAADALAWGFVLGIVFQACILAWMLKNLGFQVTPWWHEPTDALRQTVRQFIPMIAGTTLMSSTTLIDQLMAAMLDPGSVAALDYANKIVMFVIGLGATALGTAALPYFSAQVAGRDWQGLRETRHFYVSRIFLITLPLAGMGALFAGQIVKLVFERGAFTADDTTLVSHILQCFIIQIPFYIAGILAVRVISAIKENHILLYGNIISVVLNVTLNYIFMRWIGVTGIALSTSIVYIVSFLYLTLALNSRLNALSSANDP
jgi:putative peptidoglycan lipid II flippase